MRDVGSSQQEVEAANDAVAAGTGQFCSFSEGRNATADAILICGGLLPGTHVLPHTRFYMRSSIDLAPRKAQ